jgi:hypothetical protein
MLESGGAVVQPIGFRRNESAAELPCPASPVDLGLTSDGQLAARVISVFHALSSMRQWADKVQQSHVVLARNLEMLLIANRFRNRYAPSATLVYECLDIHRLLLSGGLSGALLRSLEFRLWREVDLLLTSSQAFVTNYFLPRNFRAAIRLVENKIVLCDRDDTPGAFLRPPPGPPWRIGWFGAIRCRKSLQILGDLAKACDGGVEILIRGRPSGAVFPNFEAEIRDLPHVHYGGPYRNPDDLPRIYGEVHFNWAIDYYESGQNSAWLLPNRLYEGTYYGAVPMALTGVETSAWLARHHIGVVQSEPLLEHLAAFFQSLDPQAYALLAQSVQSVPRANIVSDEADCRDLVQSLRRPLSPHVAVRRGGSERILAPTTSNGSGTHS